MKIERYATPRRIWGTIGGYCEQVAYIRFEAEKRFVHRSSSSHTRCQDGTRADVDRPISSHFSLSFYLSFFLSPYSFDVLWNSKTLTWELRALERCYISHPDEEDATIPCITLHMSIMNQTVTEHSLRREASSGLNFHSLPNETSECSKKGRR